MAIRATHVPSGTDIAIGPLIDSVSQTVIGEIFQGCGVGVLECREHDSDPRLAHLRRADGRVHEAWVYLQHRYEGTQREQWVICHHPHGIGRDFRSHIVPVGKSDQHQWEQDYISRAAEDGGFRAEQEVVLPSGTRLDVKIDGAVGTVGFEVQHSFLSRGKVQSRTRKATLEGIPLVWCADHKGPDWAFKVPHFEANEGVPGRDTQRGSWTVTTGPRRILRVKCEPWNADRLPRCWKPGRRHRNWCGEYHPVFEPISGLVVDAIAQQVPSGALVPLDTRTKQGVILVPATHYDLWQNEFASQVSGPRRTRNDANPCSYRPHLSNIQQDCTGCGQRLLLHLPGRVLCERCRLENRKGSLEMAPTLVAELPSEVWRRLASDYDH